MTEREKIAHLLRRFGLGAGKYEVDLYEPLGVAGTINQLIDYDKVDEQFPIDPWEMTGYGDNLIQFDPPRFGSWWALRLFLTRRPLQERLTLFWHNHFAVSAEKVADGPGMLRYLQVLRQGANGNFRTLLKDVSKTTAMILYLDTQQSYKDHPNENFAREVMELFTMGQGHYSESDVKEAARAFTGWSLHYVDIGGNTPYDKLTESMARQGRSVFSYCVVPDMHDAGTKNILGKSGNFDGDAVLDLLCERPETAKFITSKLAKWFIGAEPSEELARKLSDVFVNSGYEIKPVLRAIAESNDFWSPQNVRSRSKSPVDFYPAMFRCMNLQPLILSLRGEVNDRFKPMKPEVKGVGEALYFLMSREGLLLLYPPNVSGWEWGNSWITSANMASRYQLPNLLFKGDDKNRPITQLLSQKLREEFKVQTPTYLVNALIDIFDLDVKDDKHALLVKTCVESGGVAALEDKEKASDLFVKVVGLMVAAPEFHVY